MAFVFSLANLVVLLQLSLLFRSFFVAYGHRTLEQYQPGLASQPPTMLPPSHPPISPSAQPPIKPPSNRPAPSYLFPRRKVVVYGVVNCIYCPSISSPRWVSDPLPGAVVKLQCNNTQYTLEEQTTSGEGGNIVFVPGRGELSTFGAHKCKVFLVSSNNSRCTEPDYLGLGGDTLKPSTYNMSFGIFTVGPFDFGPAPGTCGP